MRVVIIGGGISGLSLAFGLTEMEGMDVTVLEAASRAGGKVWSEHDEGFILERGVNGFLDNKPPTLDLAARLSLITYPSSDNARKRFVYSGGRLNQLPESPQAFLRSGLISIPGKLRMALEPLIPKAPPSATETLAQFGRRRLGREAFSKLIDPMASGIFAGDPEKMSLSHCFPRINALEQEYGSLIRAMIKLSIKRRKNVGGGPGGTLTSFEGGLGEMTDALRDRLGQRVRLGAEVRSIDKLADIWNVHLADGSSMEADTVVMACPAHKGGEIIRELDASTASAMRAVYYPPLSVVCTGFRREAVNIPLDAFGYLIPFGEGRRILGTLYDSSVFSNRAPVDRVLLRTMTGGARAPEVAQMEDDELGNLVLDEISHITGLRAEPDFVRIYRHTHAIPQYTLGHSALLEAVQALQDRHKGLYITGNAYKGVSFNDCIANSMALAEKIAIQMQ